MSFARLLRRSLVSSRDNSDDGFNFGPGIDTRVLHFGSGLEYNPTANPLFLMLQIDGKLIGGQRAFVCAEAGSNHCGSLDIARQLVRAAADAGADAVKFQKRDNRSLYTREFYSTPYNSENAYGPTYGQHREALELPIQYLRNLRDYAAQLGISIFSTTFDISSVDVCMELGFPAIKLASGSLTNLPLISYAAATGKPLMLSTGGASHKQVVEAVLTARGAGAEELVVMQCTASYPAVYEELNLRYITTLQNAFLGVIPGASLHTNGIAMGPVAYTLGARVLEMHVTLDRTMRGTDHAFSLEPRGLGKLVRDIRRTEAALGNGIKLPFDSEREPIRKMSCGIYPARPLPSGHVLSLSDLELRSPGDELTGAALPSLMGRKLCMNVMPDDPIRETCLEPTQYPAVHAAAH